MLLNWLWGVIICILQIKQHAHVIAVKMVRIKEWDWNWWHKQKWGVHWSDDRPVFKISDIRKNSKHFFLHVGNFKIFKSHYVFNKKYNITIKGYITITMYTRLTLAEDMEDRKNPESSSFGILKCYFYNL